MVKAADIYLEQFARLGVFSKVEALAAAPAAQLSADGETVIAAGQFFHDIFEVACSISFLSNFKRKNKKI